jgi:hypothetical protein
MKDRLVTFGLALAALGLFYALFAPKPEPPQERPTRPITTEQGPNGYLAMWRWFEAAQLHPISLRHRYGELPRLADTPASGNVLISTAPHVYSPRTSEITTLRDWISAGNTLLVVAGLSDTPEWSMAGGPNSSFMNDLQATTGLNFTQVPDPNADKKTTDDKPSTREQAQAKKRQATAQQVNPFQKLDPPQRFEMAPKGDHPLLAGVRSVAAMSEYPTAQWRAATTISDVVLELTEDPKTHEPMMWLASFGKGQVLVIAYGSPFTNKMLGENDNARLLANIVNLSRSAQGRIIIDDAHQGLVAFYDPAAFFGDKRLHNSLWWLLALWLVFVLGSQRLRPVSSRWHPIDVTSFVRASGGFMSRVLKPATAAQQLFTIFFNDLRRQTGLPVDGQAAWDLMAARSVPQQDVEQLRDLHAKAEQGRRIDLTKLQNLLVQVRHDLT